ncbi:MAG: glycosyltransferase family 4 protein [Akkermansiaceae bacterium]|nr:glycosyltransferase family 4 protein [Armatimonadota bacterium]
MNIGFALEYSLGHATHADNLKHFVGDGSRSGVRPFFVDVPFENTPVGMLARLPGVRSNWSLRASCGAYLGMRKSARRLDAALFHTQVTSLLSAGLMRRLPSVISLDATPLQYDRIGTHYGHTASGNASIEALKKRVNERAFRAAKHLVTWSEWAKASLVSDYGVSEQKVTVIPPGIDLKRWHFPKKMGGGKRELNLLFVGGDFERKGGDTLLCALTEHLPAGVSAHLHVVTRSAVNLPSGAPVTIHRGLGPNCDALRRLYADADAFVFPTRADCLPLAVLEAMASGLPVITTDVGALSEAVGHGEAGIIVPPDDPRSLARAIATLASSPELRDRYSTRARQIAEERFDGTRNYARLLTVLTETAERKSR